MHRTSMRRFLWPPQGRHRRVLAASAGHCPTHISQVNWRRIILDEAHCIKDRRCNTAQAVFALQARWVGCLSLSR